MKRLTMLAILAVGFAGCDGDDEPEATPTQDATSTVTAVAPTSAASPTATVTPGGPRLISSKVQLIDLETGKVTTLYDSSAEAAFDARFHGEVVEVVATGGTSSYNLDGSSATPPKQGPACDASGSAAVIAGRTYTGVPSCGAFSPDGAWMLFQVDAGEVTGPFGGVVPSWDQWVVNVATGATTELQRGLVHCGGCDARYGPRWAPTSAYVAYAEYGGPRRFLSEVATGETRVIGAGNEVDFAPVWAPRGNFIVYSLSSSVAAPARLEDLDAERVADLRVAWPVTYDPSGDYLYSPSYGAGPKSPPGSTTVLDARTLEVVAQLPGEPAQWLSWVQGTPLLGTASNGYTAALQGAAGCDGTVIHSTLRAEPYCVLRGTEGQVAPGGARVAVTRPDETTGPAEGPGFHASQMVLHSIVVVDVATGAERVLLKDVPGWDYGSPLVVWNEAGTLLLVLSPRTIGL